MRGFQSLIRRVPTCLATFLILRNRQVSPHQLCISSRALTVIRVARMFMRNPRRHAFVVLAHEPLCGISLDRKWLIDILDRHHAENNFSDYIEAMAAIPFQFFRRFVGELRHVMESVTDFAKHHSPAFSSRTQKALLRRAALL